MTSPRARNRGSGFFRQASFGRERSLSSPKTPTDARTKRRLNTLLSKAGVVPRTANNVVEDVDTGITTVRREYKLRLTKIFEKFNPEKVDNITAILNKHGNNLHSIYLKVCKKYDEPTDPEYSGPSKAELEGAIETLGAQLSETKTSQSEFQFHLEEALDAGEKLMLVQDELNDRNTNLESMVESARAAAGEQSALQQARLQGEINGLSTENKRLGKDKVQLLQLKHDLEDRINELMGERDKDGDLILKLNDDIENLKQRVRELEDTHSKAIADANEQLSSTKQSLTRQLTWAKQTAKEDQDAYETQMNMMTGDANGQIDDLKHQIAQLSENLDAERDDNRKLGKHKVQLLQVRRTLEDKVETLETERDADGDLILKLNDDIERMKAKGASLQEEIENLNNQIVDIGHEREKDSDQMAALDEDIQMHKSIIQRKEDKIARLQDERESDGDLIIKLNDDIEKFKLQCAGLQGELEETQHTLERTIATWKRKHENSNQDYEDQLAALREAKQDAQIAYEGRIQGLREDMADLKQTLEDTTNAYEDKNSSLRDSKFDAEVRYEQQIKALQDELMSTQGSLAIQESTSSTLQRKIEGLEDERDKDGDLILRLNDDCDKFRKKIAELESHKRNLHEEFQQHKVESEQKFHQTTSTLKRQMTFVEESHKEKYDSLSDNKANGDKHASAKISAMNRKISELTDSLEMERTENGKKIAAYKILRKKFDNQEKEMANMMDDLIHKTSKMRELEKSLKSSNASGDASDQMKRQQRLQNLRVQELELEIERINRTSKSKIAELEETCILFQRDLKKAKTDLSSSTREKQELMANSNGGGMTDNAITKHLQNQLRETKRKYEQSNETVIRLDEALRGALAKQDDFTGKITELKQEILRLQRKTHRTESLISDTTIE